MCPPAPSRTAPESAPASASFETQALSGLSPFFQQAKTAKASVALHVHSASAIIRLSVRRFNDVVLALSGIDAHEQRLMYFKEMRARLLREGLFDNPKVITRKDKNGKELEPISVRFEFPEDTDEILDEIAEFILGPELKFAQKNYPSNHRDYVEILGADIEKRRAEMNPILKRNPLKIIARDVKTGKIAGFVYPDFVHAKNAAGLPDTWAGMSRWMDDYDPHNPKRIMADAWFTGGGSADVALAMLDASYELGKLMGMKKFFAYSNPRALPFYWERFLELKKNGKLTAEHYAARVVAPFIFERMSPYLAKNNITSWEKLESYLNHMMKHYVQDSLRQNIADALIADLRQEWIDRKFPVYASRKDFISPKVFTAFIAAVKLPLIPEKPKEGEKPAKPGYTILDAALSTHWGRKSRLARIIPNAFPDIPWNNGEFGPGIGGGYSFVMEYRVELRHLLAIEVGDDAASSYWKYREYLEKRKAEAAKKAVVPTRREVLAAA